MIICYAELEESSLGRTDHVSNIFLM